MTNKEAIEELKKVDTLDMPARLCEAHYMAIKALKQYGALQEIRQKIKDIPIPYDDKDTLEHQYGEGLIRDAVIEIIDKRIKEYEDE